MNYRFGGDVEEARSAASSIEIVSAEKVLLSMTCDLCWSSSFHEIPGDSSPVSFSNFLQSNQEKLVFFFGPWDT